jgi:phosphoglycerate dehydrogenase-like enzyme
VREGRWPAPLGLELADRRWALSGSGTSAGTSRESPTRSAMKVLAWGRTLDAAELPTPGEAVDLDALMRRADIVSIHATLAPETRGLIDARRLALMKPTAFLVNTRAGRSSTSARSSTRSRPAHRGAALDVFDEEPLPPAIH